MARILLTWELGAGLGHLSPIAAMADLLARRGHQVTVALHELEHAADLFDGTDVRLLSAPFKSTPPSKGINPARSFAQLLNNCCFDNADAACGRMVAWRNLFELVRPDVVVFDHSPTALAASRGLDLKRIVMGTGFFWPPDRQPLPLIGPAVGLDFGAIIRDEAHVLRNVNDALVRLNAPPLSRLAELYHQADDALLTTFPELDHFGARPEARYYGVISRSGGDRPVWPDGDGPRVYAYLKPFRTIDALLQKLTDLRLPTLIYPDGINHATRDRFAGPTLRFAERRLDLDAVGDQADLAILNANHATTAELLLKGVPSLHIPRTVEQTLLAHRLEGLGACLTANREADTIIDRLDQMTDALEVYADAARGFASAYQAFDPRQALAAMADRLVQVLGLGTQGPDIWHITAPGNFGPATASSEPQTIYIPQRPDSGTTDHDAVS